LVVDEALLVKLGRIIENYRQLSRAININIYRKRRQYKPFMVSI